MILTVQTFWMPKSGNTEAEYEDSFWPAESGAMREIVRYRCAVADGATETSFSGIWANILTRQWCGEVPDICHYLKSLPELGEQWRREVGNAPLPWYAEEKARAGAFSSLLGFQVQDASSESNRVGCWEALAVGDTCLFQLRDEKIIDAFPLTHSEEFNSRPFLLGSKLSEVENIEHHIKVANGECQIGDLFYLMTDALAAWFLKLQEEEDGSAAQCIADISEQKRFEEFVQEYRVIKDANGILYLRNDDVTLVRLRIDG